MPKGLCAADSWAAAPLDVQVNPSRSTGAPWAACCFLPVGQEPLVTGPKGGGPPHFWEISGLGPLVPKGEHDENPEARSFWQSRGVVQRWWRRPPPPRLGSEGRTWPYQAAVFHILPLGNQQNEIPGCPGSARCPGGTQAVELRIVAIAPAQLWACRRRLPPAPGHGQLHQLLLQWHILHRLAGRGRRVSNKGLQS